MLLYTAAFINSKFLLITDYIRLNTLLSRDGKFI